VPFTGPFKADGPGIDGSIVVAEFAETPYILKSRRGREVQYEIFEPNTCYTADGPVYQYVTSGRLALQFDRLPDEGVGRLVSDEGHVFTGLPVIGVGITAAVHVVDFDAGVFSYFGLIQPISRVPGYP
jgi:hypothetical protein